MTKKPKTTKPGTVVKVIKSPDPVEPEKAEIAVNGAEPLYSELRVENTLENEDGKKVKLKPGAQVQVTIEADPNETVAKTGHTMPSILIADDSAAFRRGLRTLLQRGSAFHVIEAVDGLDAIRKAKTQQPDLIVLDLSMPRMNGLDVARVLRAEMADVPIILFTMYAVLPSLVIEKGINAVVVKGDTAALLARIEGMLRVRSKNTPD